MGSGGGDEADGDGRGFEVSAEAFQGCGAGVGGIGIRCGEWDCFGQVGRGVGGQPALDQGAEEGDAGHGRNGGDRRIAIKPAGALGALTPVHPIQGLDAARGKDDQTEAGAQVPPDAGEAVDGLVDELLLARGIAGAVRKGAPGLESVGGGERIEPVHGFAGRIMRVEIDQAAERLAEEAFGLDRLRAGAVEVFQVAQRAESDDLRVVAGRVKAGPGRRGFPAGHAAHDLLNAVKEEGFGLGDGAVHIQQDGCGRGVEPRVDGAERHDLAGREDALGVLNSGEGGSDIFEGREGFGEGEHQPHGAWSGWGGSWGCDWAVCMGRVIPGSVRGAVVAVVYQIAGGNRG